MLYNIRHRQKIDISYVASNMMEQSRSWDEKILQHMRKLAGDFNYLVVLQFTWRSTCTTTTSGVAMALAV